MGQHVKVRYATGSNESWCSGCTVGNEYHAIIPNRGEIDFDGEPVRYDDEVWIVGDDDRQVAVGQLSDGFEIVRME